MRKCLYCGKMFKVVRAHHRGCQEKKNIDYWLERKYVYKDWISGACKIYLALRNSYTDKQQLNDCRKNGHLEDLKMAKEFLRWEKRHGIRFSYNLNNDKLSCTKLQQGGAKK